MEHRIKIVSKVIDKNNNVVWYNDSNGIRFTPDEIQKISSNQYRKGNKYTVNALREVYNYKNTVHIIENKSKNLESDPSIKTLKLIDSRIYIITEDAKSGRVFYTRMIEALFPDVQFEFRTADGFGGIKNIVNDILANVNTEDIELVVIMYDNKQETANVAAMAHFVVNELETANIKVATFKPVSVEEVILSSCALPFNGFYYSHISKYLTSGVPYYTYDPKHKSYNVGNNTVKNLEEAIFNELKGVGKNGGLYGSGFKYDKGKIGSCYFCHCCNRYIGSEPYTTRCDYQKNKSNTVTIKQALDMAGVDAYAMQKSLLGLVQILLRYYLGIEKNKTVFNSWDLSKIREILTVNIPDEHTNYENII